MATDAAGPTMAKKRKTAEPLESVKLPADVMRSARIVATLTGETLTDILGAILRPALAKREREEMARRTKQLEGEK